LFLQTGWLPLATTVFPSKTVNFATLVDEFKEEKTWIWTFVRSARILTFLMYSCLCLFVCVYVCMFVLFFSFTLVWTFSSQTVCQIPEFGVYVSPPIVFYSFMFVCFIFIHVCLFYIHSCFVFPNLVL